MAVIHDVSPAFELFQPRDVEAALALLEEYGADGWAFAGGMDSLDWFKDRVKRPRAVIDLNGIESLRGIQVTPEGVEIGALTTLTTIAEDAAIRQRFPTLARAAGRVASPQIRNVGTLGGNVSQDTRCWYYRSGWPCYRAGGNVCYASAPTALNREHAILDANRCVAVTPSDTAPVLVALGAQMVVRRGGSERVVEAEDYFIGPDVDITRMTMLKNGDLLTAIRVPTPAEGTRHYFEKVADRESWDFPLVNVASAVVTSGGTIQQARIAVGGVAARPLRLHRVEEAVTGRPLNEETLNLAGELAVEGAKPLRHNAYKVNLMRNLVKRSLRGEEA